MTRWGRMLTRTLLAVTAVSAPLLGAATPAFAATDTLQAKVDPNQGPFGTEFTVTVTEHLSGGQKCGGKVVLVGAGRAQAISGSVDMPESCQTTVTATTPALWNLAPGGKSFFAVLTRGAVVIASNKLTFFVTLGTGTPRSSAPPESPTPTRTPTPTKTPKTTLTTGGAPTVQDSPPDFGALINSGNPVDTGTTGGVGLKQTGKVGSMLGLGIAGAVLIVLGFATVLFLLLRRRDDQPPADEQPAYPGGGPHDPTYGGGYEGSYAGGAYASAGASTAPTMGGGSAVPYGGAPATGSGSVVVGYGEGPATGGFGETGYGAGPGGSYGASPGGNWQAQPSGPLDRTAIGPPLTAPTDPWALHDDTDVVPRLPNRPEPPTGR
jgi:hypothetical protein